eukprot:Gb_29475 [translate_table: standard]
MGDRKLDKGHSVSEPTDCSSSNDTLNSTVFSEKSLVVQSETGSLGNCTLESTAFCGESCISTTATYLEESSVNGLPGFSLQVPAKPPIAGLHRQDIVQCTEREGLVGMVTKVAGDSDSDSSSSDSEEHDDSESIAEGHARIVWTNLSETIEKIDDIMVIDRGFLHGDIVAAASDASGQTGTVVNVDLRVDLLTPSSATIKNVASRNLRRIRAFAVGDYVIHGPWLGRVDAVVDNVTIMFDDSSKCKLVRADPERLMPVSKNLLEDAHYPYHHGQRVRASSSAVFRNARWLRGTWKANRMEGTVSNVEVGSVYVYWIAAANPGYNSHSTTIPAEQQDPKRLKLLSCFSYANWQLGDWCLLPTSARRISEVTVTRTEDAVSDEDTEAYMDNGASQVLDSDSTVGLGSKGKAHESWAEDTETPADKDILSTSAFDSGSSAVSGSKETMQENMDRETEAPVDNGSVPILGSGSTTVLGSKEAMHENWVTHRKKIRKCVLKRDRRAHKKDDGLEGALFVVNTQTKVDVVWQDGTRASGVDSRTLIPVDNLGDHDFYPEQYVLEKGSEEDGVVSEARRVGVVKSVDSKQRTARVRWLKPVARPEDAREFDEEEVVSVYELAEHPDYNYCIGDIVIRLSPAPEASEIPTIVDQSGDQKECADKLRPQNDAKTTELSSEQKALKKSQKAEIGGSFEESNLSWIGNITGLKDGEIEVAWADGMVSKVGPQAIFVVGRDEDEGSIQSSLEEDDEDDAASWETVDSNGMDALEKDEQHEHLEEVTERMDCQPATDSDHDVTETKNAVHPEENLLQKTEGSLSIPRAAFGFVARLATGLLGFRGSRRLLDTSNSSSQEQASQKHLEESEVSKVQGKELTSDFQCLLPEPKTSTQGTLPMPDCSAVVLAGKEKEEPKIESECSDSRGREQVTCRQGSVEFPVDSGLGELISNQTDIDQAQEEDILPSLPGSGDHGPRHFKHFDSVKDPVDHYFLNERGQPSDERKWTKKVQQDWTILEKNLPDTIYVRVYEDRMDLLRAVIIGAAGTPYQDGLFFFDIHLPPEYPHAPPSAYYHSGGLRLNPNLYETGKVCLSLLNTWTGRGNEVWDPTSSSILQVLVSLQGLVLNAKPYFNEAGYDKQIGSAEGEKNSLAYNENTFLLSCKSMLYLLRRPPKHFEMFVKEHFQKRGHYILCACDAYMKGAQVGSLSEDATLPSNAGVDSQNTSSVGFKLMLAKIVPKLVLAFSEVGVDWQQFLSLESKQSEGMVAL